VDGGYLLPRDLSGISDCFSPGAENRKAFEDELAVKFAIRTHIMDYSSDLDSFSSPWIDGMQTFTKKWLGPKPGTETMTMVEWLDWVKPSHDRDWLLQMDVEGAEFEIIPSISPKIMGKFRCIVLEIHDLDQILTQSGAARVALLVRALTKFHTVAHVRPNNCCGSFDVGELPISLPRVAELTLVRSDEMQSKTFRRLQPSPHPREILWNKKFKKPLHLDPRLLSSKRSLGAIIRIFFDHIAFFARAFPKQGVRISVAGLIRNLSRSLFPGGA
jgi:hypothetical protein